jgi:membrane protein involved in colicin uptake
MDSQPTDKVEGVGDDFVRGPGGTVTTSAYKDGKKRCLSAERGSGDPRRKVKQQNDTFMRADRKIGRGLNEDEIRAEAQKRQKEMGDAARAAEMTKDEVALEKWKGLAEKEAARKAATGQAGKAKRAAEEAKRWAATGQADKDKHAGVEAARKAATGQAGAVKLAAEKAKRWAAAGKADKDKHAGVEAKRKASKGQTGKVKRAAEEAKRWAATGRRTRTSMQG